MASSASMKRFNPSLVLIVMFGAVTTIFALSIISTIWLSRTQSQNLLSYEFAIMLKGNGHLINSGNYREFAQRTGLVGNEFLLVINKNGNQGEIVFGESRSQANLCTQQSYFEYDLKFCRPAHFPAALLTVVLLTFALVVSLSIIAVVKMNRSIVESFKGLFQTASIQHEKDLKFSDAWNIANNLATQFTVFQKAAIENEKRNAILQIAHQVAHDIRSPVSAINMVIASTLELQKDRRELLIGATKRINDIAEELLRASRVRETSVTEELPTNSAELPLESLTASILKIVNEKRILSDNVLFTCDLINAQATVIAEQVTIERILSNVFQNALEAVGGTETPRIEVATRLYTNQVQIIVSDNGVGIPEHILNRLGEFGISYGKSNGNGIGIASARQKILEWHGSLDFSSKTSVGTFVTINLRRTSPG